MSKELQKKIGVFGRYAILIIVGFLMIYPLIWMVGASFKTNDELFSTIGVIPLNPTVSGYTSGFAGFHGMSIWHFFANTYKIVIPKVIATVLSATLTAYAFARFEFPGKKLAFALMISTLFLPQVVLNAPQYVLFDQLGWLDSYLPLIIPSMFACDTFFVYMLVQFLRQIPRELDEASEIDGCGILQRLFYVIAPILKPAMTSCVIFQFMWSSNDFMGPLIYVNTVAKYPMSIYLRMSMDADVGFDWNKVLAMSLVAIVPSLIVFFIAQNSFVDGIAAGSVKG